MEVVKNTRNGGMHMAVNQTICEAVDWSTTAHFLNPCDLNMLISTDCSCGGRATSLMHATGISM